MLKSKRMYELAESVEIAVEDELDVDTEEYLLEGEAHGDGEITDEDYGFVLDSNGDLKSLFMPGTFVNIPKQVFDILKIYGIEDIHEIKDFLKLTVH